MGNGFPFLIFFINTIFIVSNLLELSEKFKSRYCDIFPMKEKEERVVRSKKDATFKAKAGEQQNIWLLIPMVLILVPMGLILVVMGIGMVVAAAISGDPELIMLALMLAFMGLLVMVMGGMMPYLLLARVPFMHINAEST